MNNLLEKSSHTHRDKRTVKFSLDCSDNSPDTRRWLSVIKKIADSPDSGILEGSVIHMTKKIAVKFQNATNSSKEYQTSLRLFHAGIPNFIKYYCSFTCSDDVKKFINMKAPEYICGRDGDIMGYIVMPLYREGSVTDYRWVEKKIKILKSVVKQTILALASAFIRLGFVHEDLHTGNILVRKTKKTEINYPDIDLKVPTEGMFTIVMDFQRSSFSSDIEAFKRSMRKLFGCLRSPGGTSFLVLDNSKLINGLSNFDEVNKKSISNLLNLVDDMKILYSNN